MRPRPRPGRECGTRSRRTKADNRHDPPMAAPPQRFRAHDRAMPQPAQVAEPRKAGVEGRAHRIVGVIVEALVLPERINAQCHVALPAATPAQRRDVLVGDRALRKRPRQRIAVELRIGARMRYCPDVDDLGHVGASQKCDEIADGAPRMADGVKGVGHSVEPGIQGIRSRKPAGGTSAHGRSGRERREGVGRL